MIKPDGTFQQDIQCIVPQQNGKGAIFISNLQAASNPLTLKKHNIGAVITAIKGKNLSQIIPRHIQYFYIPVIDHQSCDISIYFKDSYQFIQEQRKRTNILVHCMAGVSRSVTLVIAYIMEKSNISYQNAYNYVKSKRNIIHPNQSFIQQLKKLQQKLKIKSNQINNQLKDIGNNYISNGNNYTSNSKKYIVQNKNKSVHQINIPLTIVNNKYEKVQQQIYKQKMQKQQIYQIKNESRIKQNIKGNNISNYDQMLRKNIQKLFTMTKSQIRLIENSRLR